VAFGCEATKGKAICFTDTSWLPFGGFATTPTKRTKVQRKD